MLPRRGSMRKLPSSGPHHGDWVIGAEVLPFNTLVTQKARAVYYRYRPYHSDSNSAHFDG